MVEVIASEPGLHLIDDEGLISVGVRGVTGGLRAGTRIVEVISTPLRAKTRHLSAMRLSLQTKAATASCSRSPRRRRFDLNFDVNGNVNGRVARFKFQNGSFEDVETSDCLSSNRYRS